MKIQVYFLQYKLLGYQESEPMEFLIEQTANTIAGKLNLWHGSLVEEVKQWKEDREVAGSSSSGSPTSVPESALSDVSTELEALRKRLAALENKGFGV